MSEADLRRHRADRPSFGEQTRGAIDAPLDDVSMYRRAERLLERALKYGNADTGDFGQFLRLSGLARFSSMYSTTRAS